MYPIEVRQPVVRALTVAAVLAVASASYAVVYTLRADIRDVTMPDGVVVPMWGFADDTSGPGDVTIPGPPLVVPPGDSVLTIRLKNNLTPATTGLPQGVPVSVVIPGQASAEQPVRFEAGSPYEGRIRSLARETPPDGATLVEYTWPNMKPGTFLYQSGTTMQAQVQMGLYGAVKKDASAGQAYNGVPYTQEATLVFSEIDPDFHQAVATDQYGPGKSVTSTIDYRPKYFLVNGQPHAAGSLPVPIGNANDTVLLRLLNAGLQNHVPSLGVYMNIVAEAGNPYRYPKQQYSTLVPALGTVDAIVQPARGGQLPLLDRRLFLTTGAGQPGGMLAYLDVQAPAGLPLTTEDYYDIPEDTTLEVPSAGVLGNDGVSDGAGGIVPGPVTATIVSSASHGTLNLRLDGSFTYAPNTDFVGRDSFVYRAQAGALVSRDTVVAIDVMEGNDPPVAVNDDAQTPRGTSVLIDVLANDSDPEGDHMMIMLRNPPARGTAVVEAGKVRYTPQARFAGTDTFKYQASDGSLQSNVATVTVRVTPPVNPPRGNGAPTARGDSARIKMNTEIVIDVLANDRAAGGSSLDPSSLTITRQPTSGMAMVHMGTIMYTPAPGFVGTVRIQYTVADDQGRVSRPASVSISVTR